MKPHTLITSTMIIAGPLFTVHAEQARETLAAVLIAEAGGEGKRGLEAVYEVLCTRAKLHRKSLLDIVLQPKQFSCLNDTTPARLVAKWRSHPQWAFALSLVGHEPKTDWTQGSTHYLNPRSLKRLPQWAKRENITVVVGNHTFYKLH